MKKLNETVSVIDGEEVRMEHGSDNVFADLDLPDADDLLAKTDRVLSVIAMKGRIARPVEDLDDDTLKAIANSAVPDEYEELNALLTEEQKGAWEALRGVLKGKGNDARLSIAEINDAITEAGVIAGMGKK